MATRSTPSAPGQPGNMSNLDFMVKLTGQLLEAELAAFYVLVRDRYVYRIPFPLPGQRPGATPGRYAYATPKN